MTLSTLLSLALLSSPLTHKSSYGTSAFSPISAIKRAPSTTTNTPPPLTIASLTDDDENNSGNHEDVHDDDDDDAWQTGLQQRHRSLQKTRSRTHDNWRSGEFRRDTIGLPDWVRRLSISQWPIAACGTSSGDVYVVHCATGRVLGRGETTTDQRRYEDVGLEEGTARAVEELYGEYDGGGTLAIGMSWGNIVSHAGRNGGVEFWQFDPMDDDDDDDDDGSDTGMIDGKDDQQMKDLKYIGLILEDVLVTSLDWTEDDVWIGTQDGRVLVYNIDVDEKDEELKPYLLAEWKNLGGTVLSLKCDEELDVAVATTSSGSVKLLSVEKPEYKSFSPPFESKGSFSLCATIIEEGANKFSIVCGGSDGSIFKQSLNMLEDAIDAEIDSDDPFTDSATTRLLPNHEGRCKCLVSPFPGIVLSGGQDGTIRVWDLKGEDDAELKYLIGGFKVWLGSFWTDGECLVSDGADNSISILKFGV